MTKKQMIVKFWEHTKVEKIFAGRKYILIRRGINENDKK